MTFVLLCHVLGCSQRQKWKIPNCILFEWRQIYFRKGRTGKESITQSSIYPLYIVTLWIRHPVIGPPFTTIQSFRDWGPWLPWPSLPTPLTIILPLICILLVRHNILSRDQLSKFGRVYGIVCMCVAVSVYGLSTISVHPFVECPLLQYLER